MPSLGREVTLLCGIAVAAGGLAAVLALLFVPLPLQREHGQVVGFCGPGLTSDNAMQVRLDPGVVNTGAAAGTSAGTPAQQQSFERFCSAEAGTRLAQAGVTAALALVIGVPLLVAGARQDSRPGSVAPPGLSPSSSGTPGSTVWK